VTFEMGSSVEVGLVRMSSMGKHIAEMPVRLPAPEAVDELEGSALRPVFVALVGPPGRGKSASIADLLVPHFRQRGFAAIQVWNAGEVRRAWERHALTHAGVIEALRGDLAAALAPWRTEAAAALHHVAVPEAVFRDFPELNERFAAFCLSHGLARLAASAERRAPCVFIFDATNTDCARRSAIIEQFKGARAGGADIDLVFLENICPDPAQLLRNFTNKLTISGDFAPRFARMSCAQALANTATRGLNQDFAVSDHPSGCEHAIAWLVRTPHAQVAERVRSILIAAGTPDCDAAPCAEAYAEAMASIATRDITAYQTKYTPLHVPAQPGGQSTIDELDAINAAVGLQRPVAAFVQVVHLASAACPQRKKTVSSNYPDVSLLCKVREHNMGAKYRYGGLPKPVVDGADVARAVMRVLGRTESLPPQSCDSEDETQALDLPGLGAERCDPHDGVRDGTGWQPAYNIA
jgi:6-phosphofructo-2-kinase